MMPRKCLLSTYQHKPELVNSTQQNIFQATLHLIAMHNGHLMSSYRFPSEITVKLVLKPMT